MESNIPTEEEYNNTDYNPYDDPEWVYTISTMKVEELEPIARQIVEDYETDTLPDHFRINEDLLESLRMLADNKDKTQE